MTQFVQSIIIIAIIGAMAFFLYRYYQHGNTVPGGKGSSDVKPEPEGGKTRFFTTVVIAELDRSGKIRNKADVIVKIGDKKGFAVGKSADADFKISGTDNVQDIHFKIGRDDAGYYVRDYSKTVGTYCNGKTYRGESFDLPFETVIYAADVPLVFIEKPKVRLDKSFRLDDDIGTRISPANRSSSEDDILRR